MKIPYLRTALFLLLLTATYFFYIHADIINLNNVLTAPYSPDDSETLYTLSSVVYRGGGLYKDFSLVYPPGRFLFQSLLFHLISPSMTVLSLYTTFPRILFPPILFLLSYYLFCAVSSSKKNFITLAFFSSIAFFTYMSYVRSAQEVHVLTALFFFIAFVPTQKHRVRKFLLGLLYGLIFLFRIDSGIMLTLSLLAAFTIREKKLPRIQIAGTALVWIPIVLLILIKGSISHFLYDTFYLGLIVQPKMMGLPIPPPPFGKIYPALLSLIFCSSLALIFDAKKIKDTFLRHMVQTFAIFATLSYAAALGRSDEPHLWYGTIWLGVMLAYCLFKIYTDFKTLTLKHLIWIPIAAISIFTISYIQITLKIPGVFIIFNTILFFIAAHFISWNPISILIGGIIASLIFFHSISYLRLRFMPPKLSWQTSLKAGIFQNDPGEVAGLVLTAADMKLLQTIQKDLDSHDKYLFIYPDHILYYDYFHLQNPSRHFYHTGETTDLIQQEIISDLERTQTTQFLVFPGRTTYKKQVWNWINKHTKVIKKYQLNDLQIELRKR